MSEKRFYWSARAKLGRVLFLSSTASIGLYLIGTLAYKTAGFWYLTWNLALAWAALLISLWLEYVLQRKLWSSWYALAITVLWLFFLPNTFYMFSDFVHIQEAGSVDLLYDVVMLSSFILNGVILGFMSLYIVHWQLVRRLRERTAFILVGLVLLACSFGIYIGRVLRWNTWDIVANPTSLLFDVSDRVINAREHPQAVSTTLSFFVLLGSLYAILWYAAKVARQQRDKV